MTSALRVGLDESTPEMAGSGRSGVVRLDVDGLAFPERLWNDLPVDSRFRAGQRPHEVP